MLRMFAGVALAALTILAGPVRAQDWPSRPVTLVVPWAAGGPVDTVARIIAARASELLGQQLVIENVGGAGGMTGTARVAKAAPDGYTLLLSGSAVLAQNPAFHKQSPYDPIADFAHVALFSDSARVLIARKDFPPNNFKEFIAYVREHQSTLQYGSSGAGGGSHTCAILLDGAMGTKITHVPYRGAGPAMQDLVGGRLDYMTEQISTATPQIKSGAVKAYATLGIDRGPGLENIPTAKELGVEWPRLRRLGLVLVPQGHAAGDRAAHGQGFERRHRYAGGDRALQGDRRCCHRQGPALAGIPDPARQIRARAVGRADQGERSRSGLKWSCR